MATPPKTGLSVKMLDLGQGSSKDALAAADAKNVGTIRNVPLDHLRVMPGLNARVKESPSYIAKVASLADSIVQNGFYSTKPLAGFVGKDGETSVIYVTDGHTRLDAVAVANEKLTEAGGDIITSLPVILKASDTSMRDLTIALVKENDGEKLSMLGNAVIASRLLKDKMTEKEVGEVLGFSDRYMKDIMLLLTAPKHVLEAVKQEKISGTEAVRVMRKEGDKAGEVIAARLKALASKGKTKATRKDSEEGTKGGTVKGGEGGEKVKMAVTKTEWAVSKGHEFPLSDIRLFKGLIPDTDWYSLMADKDGYATATEDFRFVCTVSRPKPVEAKADKAGEAAPAKKGGKKGKPAAAEPEAEGETGDDAAAAEGL